MEELSVFGGVTVGVEFPASNGFKEVYYRSSRLVPLKVLNDSLEFTCINLFYFKAERMDKEISGVSLLARLNITIRTSVVVQ